MSATYSQSVQEENVYIGKIIKEIGQNVNNWRI